MIFDVVIGGVGGQGILSIAFVIDNAALQQGLHFKQAEVHGMSQRGGAVSSHVRINDQQIYSDIISRGRADMVMAVEPMEALRHLEFLSPQGRVVASISAEKNIPHYPEREHMITSLCRVPQVVLINGKKTALEAGSRRAQNMAVLGAAAPYLPLPSGSMEKFIKLLFQPKGDKVVHINLRAFQYGLIQGAFFRRCLDQKAEPLAILQLLEHLQAATLDIQASKTWCRILNGPLGSELDSFWEVEKECTLPGDASVPSNVLENGVRSLTSLAE